MCRRKEKKNKSKCKFNDYFIKLSKNNDDKLDLWKIIVITLSSLIAAAGVVFSTSAALLTA